MYDSFLFFPDSFRECVYFDFSSSDSIPPSLHNVEVYDTLVRVDVLGMKLLLAIFVLDSSRWTGYR